MGAGAGSLKIFKFRTMINSPMKSEIANESKKLAKEAES